MVSLITELLITTTTSPDFPVTFGSKVLLPLVPLSQLWLINTRVMENKRTNIFFIIFWLLG